jgi:hypothetical protein
MHLAGIMFGTCALLSVIALQPKTCPLLKKGKTHDLCTARKDRPRNLSLIARVGLVLTHCKKDIPRTHERL